MRAVEGLEMPMKMSRETFKSYIMKKLLLVCCGLVIATLANAKKVQIIVKPVEAQASAQVLEKGKVITGSNGVFTGGVGFLKSKTYTIQADGFDPKKLEVRERDGIDVYEVTLEPNRKMVNFAAIPETATIYVDGEEMGNGFASFAINKNSSKSIRVMADGYDTYTTSVSFTSSPELVIKRECELTPNRKDVYISVLQDGARVFVDGQLVGTMENQNPVKYTIHKGRSVPVVIKKDGFMDEVSTISFLDKQTHYDFGSMAADEAYNATDHRSSDIANKSVIITVRPGLDRNQAMINMKYYVTDMFRDIDVNDNLAGWIRTSWNVDKYPTMQVRTRVELKQIPDDGSGLLKFKLLIESQKAAPNASLDPQNFSDWELLLRKYSDMSKDIRNAVE